LIILWLLYVADCMHDFNAADYMHDFNAKMAGTIFSTAEYLFYPECHIIYPTMCMSFKYFTVSVRSAYTHYVCVLAYQLGSLVATIL